MASSGSSSNPTPRSGAGFDSTQWSVVLAGQRDVGKHRAALDHLCQAYWPPVYSYLRRKGFSPSDAEDLTQGFFAELITGDFLTRPDPARGKFRSYLIGALHHYLAHRREHTGAQKRGGHARHLPLDHAEADFAALASPQLDPSAAYERAWAVTLLARAAQQLEAEQHAAQRSLIFATLRPFLYAPPSRGDYEQAAEKLQTSRATVAVWIHRLSQRLTELVSLEVAATLENPADAEQELRHLKQSLAGA
jgi:RNA polymerase sigma factor (sigma-70 family)